MRSKEFTRVAFQNCGRQPQSCASKKVTDNSLAISAEKYDGLLYGKHSLYAPALEPKHQIHDRICMKLYDLVPHIVSIMGLLAKGGEGLKIVDDIFAPILFKALLDVLLSSVWNVGLDIGPRSTIDMLWAVSK